jgi:hypothetical protein
MVLAMQRLRHKLTAPHVTSTQASSEESVLQAFLMTH